MKISPARTAAFDILKRIETEQAFSSILLAEYEPKLSRKDRALCHQLALGVLRRQMFLDRVINHFAGGKKLDAAVRVSLRLGLFQLLYLDKIPQHSAVNESVSLVQRAKKSSAKALVNAVLRRAVREQFHSDYTDEIERLSFEYSHPRWLVEKWIDQFGNDQTESILRSNNEPPQLSFRFTTKTPLDTHFDGVRESKIVSNAFVADRMTPELAKAAAEGTIYFQDEASQMVARAIALPPSGRFLDVCAAPGSKITLIATSVDAQRATLIAGDLHEKRVSFLAENCRRQGVEEVRVVRYDAERELPFAEGGFDTVLVDAPCSGTGTIRHNPEIRYSISAADVEELSVKQRRILLNASKLLRKGGSLIYSACSLEREENEAVANDFLAVENLFERVLPRVPDRFLTADGYARTYPDRDGVDGFFIAVFRRR